MSKICCFKKSIIIINALSTTESGTPQKTKMNRKRIILMWLNKWHYILGVVLLLFICHAVNEHMFFIVRYVSVKLIDFKNLHTCGVQTLDSKDVIFDKFQQRSTCLTLRNYFQIDVLTSGRIRAEGEVCMPTPALASLFYM